MAFNKCLRILVLLVVCAVMVQGANPFLSFLQRPTSAVKKQAVAGSTPVSYQGSAFLMGYYAGVTQALLEKKVLVPGVTPTAGLSGGAYTLTLAQLGWNGTDILSFWRAIVREGKTHLAHGAVGRLNALSVWALQEALPQDLSNVYSRMRIAVSQLDGSKTTLNNSASWIIDSWQSRDDLIANLLGTSYLPCYSGPTTYTIFRNQPVLDGAFSNGFKQMCPDGNVTNCIKVASWHVGPLGSATCDKRCGSDRLAAKCAVPERTTINTVLHKNDQFVDRWLLSEVQLRCPEADWKGMDPYPFPYYVPQASTLPDIYPGRFNPLPAWPPGSNTTLLACQWQNFAMAPPLDRMDDFFEMTYDLGYRDALAWHAAQQQ
uniref:PNPLA domain-containing protein n=1 Tax=Tetradesmus obliquus TaxID=3088 RepID=A0A383VPF3_TETOB|eukprot:jgi/Sobl393_1/9957/SZX67408.1